MKLRMKPAEKWIEKMVDGEIVKFLIRALTPKEQTQLVDDFTVYEWDRTQRFSRLDIYPFRVTKLDKIVKDWNVTGEDGNPLPCTKENKELVYAFNVALIEWVFAEASKFDDQTSTMEQDKSKNS